MNKQQQKHTFHVHGMHCNSCVILTESELTEVSYITHAKTSLKAKTVEVAGDFGNKNAEEIARELSEVLKPHGYSLSLEAEQKEKNLSDFTIAIPIAIAFAVLFILLQKSGLVHLGGFGQMTYGTAFFIGIIASLSTCMAVVGGLVLSMSATFAKEGDKVRPQVLFHLGRIAAFFVLGGVIGMIGSAFSLSATATFILGLVVGLVMLVLGLNLLDVFHFTKRLQPSMPKALSKHAFSITKLNHSVTPLLIGIATFFLPCGFTQSMQIYALSTGSFLKGGLSMLAFALGTFPVLALLSFSSFSIQKSSKAGIFFKSAGLVVILFALFNIINALAVAGIIPPVFNF